MVFGSLESDPSLRLLEAAWEFAAEHLAEWEAWVAIGTLALALATYLLARETRKLGEFTRREVAAIEAHARSAADEAETARQALESSARPILLNVREDPSGPTERVQYVGTAATVAIAAVDVRLATDYLHLSVPIRNAGIGIAFVDYVRLRSGQEEWAGQTSLQAIPPGETARLRFSIPARTSGYAEFYASVVESGAITVEVSYSDSSGRNQPVTRLSFFRADEPMWNLERVVLLGVWEGR